MKKQVAVLGSGIVGQTLADGLLRHGYSVMRGTREPGKLAAWKSSAGPDASVGSFADAARFGGIIVLAVKGTAAESAIDPCGSGRLAGKIEAARTIEPLCMLWCIPGLTRNRWAHAFKLLSA